MKAKGWLVLVLVLALIVSGGDAEARRRKKRKPLPTVFIGCQTVWGDNPGEGSFRLGNNLECPDDGLQIVKSGITVDLGGHRIQGPDAPGDGTDVGVFIGNVVNGVTVRNGVIAGYNRAVFVNEVTNSRVQNLTIVDSEITSMTVLNSSSVKVSGNTIIEGTDTNAGILQVQTTTTGGSNVVSGNTLSGVGLTILGSNGNTVSSNRIHGSDNAAVAISGNSQGNSIVGNTLIGAGAAAVAITGAEADENVVKGNNARGNAAGVTVETADETSIVGNALTANGDGVFLSGGADQTTIAKNTISANRDAGVELFSGLSATISGNTVVENGGTGIVAALGNNPSISDNRVDFNGYAQGLDNNSIVAGIVATGATGQGNTAKGNDISGATQCQPDICQDGPPDAPLLTTCGLTVTAARTLRNPLVCDTSATALRLSGSDFTVNLGLHVVTGGNFANESAVEIASGASRVGVTGGVLMDSENGVFTPSASPAKQVSVVGSTILRNDSEGVFLQGQDPTPDDATIEAGRHVVQGSTILENGVAGVLAFQPLANTIRSNVVTGNGVGFDITQSARNLIEKNKLIGNGTGIDISNDGTIFLPVKETVRSNTIVASDQHGIITSNMVESTIAKNTIRANGTTNQSGIALSGSGSPGGSIENVVSENTVTGSSGDGIQLANDSSENRLNLNIVRANDENGIELGTNADANIVTSNSADENGADNIDAAADAGIVVFEPVSSAEAPDIVSKNVANRNGFFATTVGSNTGNDNGFGIAIASDTDGGGNTAKGNDHPLECRPNAFC